MTLRKSLPAALAALVIACSGATAHAAADGTGPSTLVPWAKVTPTVSSEIVVINHGVDPVDLDVEFTFAGSAAAPIACAMPANAMPLKPQQQATIDVARACPGLASSGVAVDGAVSIRSRAQSPRPVRIAAAARWLIDGRSGRREQEVDVPAVPLGTLPGLDVVQRIDGIAHDDVGPLAVQTDCQLAAASAINPAPRKVEIRLERNGAPLGSPIALSVAPARVEHVPDVFAQAGLAGGAFADVQLIVGARAQPDAGLAVVCSVIRQRRSGNHSSPAITVHPGLPLDGASLVRRHAASANAGASGQPLVVRGTESALHLAFLRHQDRLTCAVRPTDPNTSADALRIAAVPPDRSRTITGRGTDIVLEDTGTRAGVAEGLGGAWALIVEQAQPNPSLGIAYRIDCSAGNGISPPLLVAVSPTPLPRP